MEGERVSMYETIVERRWWLFAALMAAMGQSDIPIIAQERAVPPIEERGDPAQPVPNVTFAQRLGFELSGRAIELHYLGPSHTDNIAVGSRAQQRDQGVGVGFVVDGAAGPR